MGSGLDPILFIIFMENIHICELISIERVSPAFQTTCPQTTSCLDIT